MPAYTIHSATTNEIESIADLIARAPASELCDFEHGSLAELLAFDQSMIDASTPVTRLVAIDHAGQLVGAAFTFRVPWTTCDQQYWCGIRVDPSARRQGIGQALYQQIINLVAAVGGQTLAIETRAENEGIIALCRRFHLQEMYRSTEWRIDPRAVDLLPLLPAWKRMQTQNISIQTLPELQQNDPDWLPKLHQLYVTLARDVPIPERATISAEQLAEFVDGLPISLPAACYVAIDAGNYIGVSFMHRSPAQPILLQKLTGVLSGHRGRGIALALKIATLQYACEQHFEQISTWIESNNPAMLNLSRKLGFVEQPGGILVFEAKL
jgi:GNAT superfamily N-acetyltransferase